MCGYWSGQQHGRQSCVTEIVPPAENPPWLAEWDTTEGSFILQPRSAGASRTLHVNLQHPLIQFEILLAGFGRSPSLLPRGRHLVRKRSGFPFALVTGVLTKLGGMCVLRRWKACGVPLYRILDISCEKNFLPVHAGAPPFPSIRDRKGVFVLPQAAAPRIDSFRTCTRQNSTGDLRGETSSFPQ